MMAGAAVDDTVIENAAGAGGGCNRVEDRNQARVVFSMPLFAIVILATISISVLAFVLSRIMMRRQRAATPPDVYEDEARIDEEGHSIRDALRFMIGPFPLSIALHVILLLVLVATIKVQNARDLLMVTLQQAGGGGGAKHDEMRDVDMPDLTMPETMPQM